MQSIVFSSDYPSLLTTDKHDLSNNKKKPVFVYFHSLKIQSSISVNIIRPPEGKTRTLNGAGTF